MRNMVMACALAAAGGCSSTGGGGDAERVQGIVQVCMPTAVKADTRFEIHVRGGCGGGGDAYKCRVLRGEGTVEVTLVGPGECTTPTTCGCEIYDKLCTVPALDARAWAFSFTGNAQHDATVDVAPGHPEFTCPWTVDGGP